SHRHQQHAPSARGIPAVFHPPPASVSLLFAPPKRSHQDKAVPARVSTLLWRFLLPPAGEGTSKALLMRAGNRLVHGQLRIPQSSIEAARKNRIGCRRIEAPDVAVLVIDEEQIAVLAFAEGDHGAVARIDAGVEGGERPVAAA